jgi:hypothetical protein
LRSFLGGVNYTIKESQFGDEGVTTMIEVSLTDFVDFLSRNGVAKVTKVREIKFRKKYDWNYDFWRILREEIVIHARAGVPWPLDTLAAMSKVQSEIKKG